MLFILKNGYSIVSNGLLDYEILFDIPFGEFSGNEVFNQLTAENLSTITVDGYVHENVKLLGKPLIRVNNDERKYEAAVTLDYSEEVTENIIARYNALLEKANAEGLPHKEGFYWDYVGGAWTQVQDSTYTPEADGSYLHPFIYTHGMTVDAGLFYTDGDNIWEATLTGIPSGFDDKAYFDIIEV